MSSRARICARTVATSDSFVRLLMGVELAELAMPPKEAVRLEGVTEEA